ncbi:MAG: OmpH family outer membrane protein [Bacteroidales bacterium]|jgi:outer membrane protein|nr:OmpH family outer membrane protein [Bacteroidales bacterium]
MKKLIFLLTLLTAVAATIPVKAQAKFGHINSSEIVQALPETDSAQNKLKAYSEELQKNVQTMQTELQNKYMEYQNGRAQWSDLIRSTKEREISEMQARITEFGEQAEADYKDKTQQLLLPITEKVKKAIEDVAKEGKYSYIFDTSTGAFLYTIESDDVAPLVKKKLGIK